jgi:EmrB/QacA subfamily drug resistance transporter
MSSALSKWHGNPWAILITLSLGFFMTLLDLTIVNIAIPNMITSLGASLDEILWIVNAYVLVLAVLLITAGRLGDLRGQRTLFVAGVVVFTAASLACGLSPNPALLIAFRAVQGVGAALLMPQTMAIIIGTFPADRRGTALGIWGAVAGLATVAGPTLGGVLVTYASWRWIFIVNVPIGVIVLAMTFAFIPDTRMARQHKLDVLGVALATAGLFCLTFALIEGQRYSWNGAIDALFVATAVLTVLFLLQQRSRQDAEPLVPFSLFRNRNFTVINGVATLVSVAILGFFLPFTIYLQSVLGYSAIKAGLILAPMSVIALVLAPVAGKMSDRVGGKYILMTGLALYGLGAGILVVQSSTSSDWPSFMPAIAVMGLGMGGIWAPMATETMRGVPMALAGAASGVNNTLRQVGSVVGSAAVGALLQNQLATTLRDEATTRSAALPADVRSRFVEGFAASAKGGIQVGPSHPATPSGIPAAVAARIQQVAQEVFQHGYVRAMHPTLILPVAAAFVAAALCLLATRHTTNPAAADAAASPTTEGAPAAATG